MRTDAPYRFWNRQHGREHRMNDLGGDIDRTLTCGMWIGIILIVCALVVAFMVGRWTG